MGTDLRFQEANPVSRDAGLIGCSAIPGPLSLDGLENGLGPVLDAGKSRACKRFPVKFHEGIRRIDECQASLLWAE